MSSHAVQSYNSEPCWEITSQSSRLDSWSPVGSSEDICVFWEVRELFIWTRALLVLGSVGRTCEHACCCPPRADLDDVSKKCFFLPKPHWGDILSPRLVFLRYLLNQCRYDHQTCSTLSPNKFAYCVKILKSRISWFVHKWRQSDVIFRRFRPKIRVYGNHRHGCGFKAMIIDLGIRIDAELGSRATKLLSRNFKKKNQISNSFLIVPQN